MKTTKKKQKAQATNGTLTIYPATLTPAELGAKFAQSLSKARNEGTNSYLDSFLVLMDRLLAVSGASFSFPDAVNINTAFEIPIAELERLFKAYVGKLEEWGVCHTVIGCYSYPIYARR